MIEKILFTGAAWGIISYIGALKVIRKEIQNKDTIISKDVKYYGISAGSIIIMLHLLNISEADILKRFMQFKEREINLTVNLIEFLRDIFHEFPDTYKIMNRSNYHIGITTKKGFRFVDHFKSNIDLANVLVGSSNQPLLINYDSRIEENGETFMDGGILFHYNKFVNNSSEKCLTIAARNPTVQVNFDISLPSLLIPPTDFVCEYYIRVGYNKMKEAIDKLHTGQILEPSEKITSTHESLWWFFRNNISSSVTFKELEQIITNHQT